MRLNCYRLACDALEGNKEAEKILGDIVADKDGGFYIACDFDGTLCKSNWPGIGAPIERNIRALKLCQRLGAHIVLWSCREWQALDEAVAWCEDRGLFFDAVNDNTGEIRAYFGVNSRKIYADEYWDDRAVFPD